MIGNVTAMLPAKATRAAATLLPTSLAEDIIRICNKESDESIKLIFFFCKKLF